MSTSKSWLLSSKPNTLQHWDLSGTILTRLNLPTCSLAFSHENTQKLGCAADHCSSCQHTMKYGSPMHLCSLQDCEGPPIRSLALSQSGWALNSGTVITIVMNTGSCSTFLVFFIGFCFGEKGMEKPEPHNFFYFHWYIFKWRKCDWSVGFCHGHQYVFPLMLHSGLRRKRNLLDINLPPVSAY